MSKFYIIGIDPGPIAGIVRLELDRHASLVDTQALQVTPGVLRSVLDALVHDGEAVLTTERFVVGPRSARSSTPAAGATTRDLIAEVRSWYNETARHYPQKVLNWYSWSAAQVKPWATDKRLDAAGLLAPTLGMRHARDAARHALYCAARDFDLPDPLSRRGRDA